MGLHRMDGYELRDLQGKELTDKEFRKKCNRSTSEASCAMSSPRLPALTLFGRGTNRSASSFARLPPRATDYHIGGRHGIVCL